ncbi:hypothetical protein ACLOJK_022108 [Asimina triloba]
MSATKKGFISLHSSFTSALPFSTLSNSLVAAASSLLYPHKLPFSASSLPDVRLHGSNSFSSRTTHSSLLTNANPTCLTDATLSSHLSSTSQPLQRHLLLSFVLHLPTSPMPPPPPICPLSSSSIPEDSHLSALSTTTSDVPMLRLQGLSAKLQNQ